VGFGQLVQIWSSAFLQNEGQLAQTRREPIHGGSALPSLAMQGLGKPSLILFTSLKTIALK
jgi:hypothetical protein